jgi:hypothetical protein
MLDRAMTQTEAILRLLVDTIGDDLIGAYVHGSAVLGGLRPRSDTGRDPVGGPPPEMRSSPSASARRCVGVSRRCVTARTSMSLRGRNPPSTADPCT